VSCHFVDERFDTGDLVRVDRFPIDPDTATAWSVDLDSQERLYELFTDVLGRALAGEELPRSAQGEGRYISGDEMDAMRRIGPGDDVGRKLRARERRDRDGGRLADGELRDVALGEGRRCLHRPRSGKGREVRSSAYPGWRQGAWPRGGWEPARQCASSDPTSGSRVRQD